MLDPSHYTATRRQVTCSLHVENDAFQTVSRTALAQYSSRGDESDENLLLLDAHQHMRAGTPGGHHLGQEFGGQHNLTNIFGRSCGAAAPI
eukprot:2520684-Prymnesium_polylepis.1